MSLLLLNQPISSTVNYVDMVVYASANGLLDVNVTRLLGLAANPFATGDLSVDLSRLVSLAANPFATGTLYVRLTGNNPDPVLAISNRFDGMRNTAQRIIEKNGELASWLVKRDAGGPAWNPTGATDVTHEVFMVFLPVERFGKETKTESDTEQRKGSMLIYMPPVSFEPSAKDVIFRPATGKNYRIVSLDAVRPNSEQTILYKILVDG